MSLDLTQCKIAGVLEMLILTGRHFIVIRLGNMCILLGQDTHIERLDIGG